MAASTAQVQHLSTDLEKIKEDVQKLKDRHDLLKILTDTFDPKFQHYDTLLGGITGTWKTTVEGMLTEQSVKQDATNAELHQLYLESDKHIRELHTKVGALGGGPQAAAYGDKSKWSLTRPKDMDPGIFSGKDEEWPKWKEALEDYVEAVHPGLKLALVEMSKTDGEVTLDSLRKNDPPFGDTEWEKRESLFTLLKLKTSIEARNVVMCAERMNGLEAWRLLTGRFEGGLGMRRMKEIAELNALQNKRCKSAAETSVILLEVDRRRRLIVEIGGQEPSNDTLANVLWLAMGPGTRDHVSSKLEDATTVEYKELKTAIMRHVSLVNATRPSRPVAMDIGSIASVVAEGSGGPASAVPQPEAEWLAVDEAGWPVDEEGYKIEGYFASDTNGQLNFVKGGGKGKGFSGVCFNCGKAGHRAAQCQNPSSAGKGNAGGNAWGKGDVKGKGKRKGGKSCHNCGELGHFARECPKKGKGKGNSYGKGWHTPWAPQGGIRALCAIQTREPTVDPDGFETVQTKPIKPIVSIRSTPPTIPTKISKNTFGLLQEEGTDNKFVFQSQKSLYKEKENAQKEFANKNIVSMTKKTTGKRKQESELCTKAKGSG